MLATNCSALVGRYRPALAPSLSCRRMTSSGMRPPLRVMSRAMRLGSAWSWATM